MVGSRLRFCVTTLTVLIFFAQARAGENIEFPEEELAAESVLPVFDNPVSVKNKRIRIAGRFEMGPAVGMSLLEPFYSPFFGGLNLTYHMKEESGVNIFGVGFGQGLSSNAQGLNPVPNTSPPQNANLQYAPAPKYLILANYQYTGFYGKISITKDYVMNLNMYGILGAGAFGIGDSTNPAFDVGLGEKFYFSQSIAFRVDFRLVGYYGPDVLAYNKAKTLKDATGEQSASNFDKKLMFPTLLSGSVVFIF